MTNIKRVFVEKKDEFDIIGVALLKDLKENLKIHNLTKVRFLNRYDIQNLEDKFYNKVKNNILSELPVDRIYEENIILDENEKMFSLEYLAGQYDQRADSAVQCIQIITGDENLNKNKVIVKNARVYILKGDITNEDIKKIKNYIINEVDSKEASNMKPNTLEIELKIPLDVKVLDTFIEKDDKMLNSFKDELGLAMNIEDLYVCQNYFKDEKRNPTITEIKMIDTYWSDHCRHTTFLTKINDIKIEEGFYKKPIKQALDLYIEERKKVYKDKEKNICLMDIAVMGMKALKNKGYLDDLDESEEINACSIEIDVDVDEVNEKWLLMFKNETHNHPTEIEPFGGAGTCLGGAIRDPLSGRSYVYQAMRITGSGNPNTPLNETIKGKLAQKTITKTAALGYSSYGNQIGLQTGLVSEIYDDGYVAKRMEIGAVIGANKKDNVIRTVPKSGDCIILVGGRTGRDGCGGATGSSKEHTEDSLLNCGAEVQKGNPPTQRKIQRLFRNEKLSKLIKRCNDFGAGGIAVAIGELADGIEINLDLVPKKYEGLDGTELAISESQERMAVVVDKNDVKKFIEYSNNENLEAIKVATVTEDRRLVMYWRDKKIVDLSRDFLDTNGALQNIDVVVKMPSKNPNIQKNDDFIQNLKDLNVCSKKGLVEMFDSTIGATNVLMPFGGKYQLTPIEAMVSKIPILKGETNTVSMMSYGFNPKISKWSTFHGALYAVVDSVSKIVATGGKYEKIRLTLQEYFERLGKNSEKWGKPLSALLGAFYAQMMLKIPAIGGKDSMSGTFNEITVPPTLVSFAVATNKVQNIISRELKETNSKIVKITTEYDEFLLPKFDKLIQNYNKINELIINKKVNAVSTIGYGGIAEAISYMALGNFIGVNINCDINLYEYEYGSFIVEIPKNVNIENELKSINYTILGETIKNNEININGDIILLEDIKKSLFGTLENIFQTKHYDKIKEMEREIPTFVLDDKNKIKVSTKIAKPTVFLPIFAGTNCEYDLIRSFEKAGAKVDTLVFKNLSVTDIKKSIKEMVKHIEKSQIIMLAGGFSAGDEPDGSGKFIASIFRNKYIEDAVMELLNKRDGLMLGICNGFQALIKLGLVPFGEIKEAEQNGQTLTHNEIGRHISCMVNTKIISNKSPWLYGTNVGDIYKMPCSHGEGRFIANKSTLDNLIKNGQIATQYVDLEGNPTYDIRYNPNGSIMAIEGITSIDGRIMGKMGHCERIGNNLYKNIIGNKNQNIFENGVKYFL